MNVLFELPLHGVACLPYFVPKQHKTLMQAEVSFASVNLTENYSQIWQLSDKAETYETRIDLYKDNSSIDNTSYILDIACQGNGKIKIDQQSIFIDWQIGGTESHHYFQTVGLALWLELKNVLCIHANALVYNDSAVSLIAPSRMGKTTLTSALCKQGFSMMTDDMMAVHQIADEYIVFPSWPVARMWPDSLAKEEVNNEAFEKVHEEFSKRIVPTNSGDVFSFCEQPKPLKAIYLLNRVEEQEIVTANNEKTALCEIKTISPARALMLLLQNSILGSAYRSLKIEHKRVVALSKLIQHIPFKEIIYASGHHNLNTVITQLKADLNKVETSEVRGNTNVSKSADSKS